MKILFIHRDLPPDSYTGVAIQVHRLANALSRAGHDLTVLTLSEKPADALYRVCVPPALPPVFVKALNRSFLKRLIMPWRFSRWQDWNYDIVHIHGDGGFLVFRPHFIRTFYGTARMEMKYAESLKAAAAQGLSWFFEKRENRSCLTAGAASGISKHIENYLPCISETIPCMLPGPPDTMTSPKTAAPSILFMGSCGSRKQGEWAFELYGLLLKDFPGLQFHYVSSRAQADRSLFLTRYGGNIREPVFHNRISQTALLALMSSSWIYLCLSSYEGFGVSLIESMACRTLVITTRTPGSSEIIQDGATGIFIDQEDAAGKIGTALKEANLRERITAHAFMESYRYAPDEIASRYAGLYRRRLDTLRGQQ